MIRKIFCGSKKIDSIKILKGFRNLKIQKRNIMYLLRKDLYNKKYYFNFLSQNICNTHYGNKENIIYNYLSSRIEPILKKKIYISIGNNNSKISTPLPKEWQRIIKKNNINVNTFQSTFLWNIHLIMIFFYSYAIFLKHIIYSLSSNNKIYLNNNYIFFFDILKKNFSLKENDKKSLTLVRWFIQNYHYNDDISIFHNLKNLSYNKIDDKNIFYTKNIFPPLDSYWKIIKYFYTFVFYSFASLFKFIFFNDWSDLFLINEFSKSLYVKIQKNNFAKSYIFNISNVLSRPLWSYELEKNQSQIYILWYSVNSISKYPHFPINIIDWPINCVINNEMKQFLKSNMYNYKNIQVVDPIWLEDSLKQIPSSSKKIIALFDIPVLKEYLRRLEDENFENRYTFKTVFKFILDVKKISKELNYDLYVKPKRFLNHKAYNKFYENIFSDDSDFIVIDPTVSYYRLIETSDIVISMPFSSTAYTGLHLNKRSCYYWPNKSDYIDINYKESSIPLIRDETTLRRWILEN